MTADNDSKYSGQHGPILLTTMVNSVNVIYSFNNSFTLSHHWSVVNSRQRQVMPTYLFVGDETQSPLSLDMLVDSALNSTVQPRLWMYYFTQLL